MTTEVKEKPRQLPPPEEPEEKVEKAPGRVFDAARDSKLIDQGSHFFCSGHLTAQPIESRSSDPRYCKSCADFLMAEADMITGTRRPQWRPKLVKESGKNNKDSRTHRIDKKTILAAPKKRGRPPITELPRAAITGLIADGTPRKEIAARMGVSERTLRRKMKGV